MTEPFDSFSFPLKSLRGLVLTAKHIRSGLYALAAFATLNANGAVQYYDTNGTAAGSGLSGGGSGLRWATGNGTPDQLWNSSSLGGAGTISQWVNGNDAVFSAAADASGAIGVETKDTITVRNITLEEGTVTISNNGGSLAFSASSQIDVASGLTLTISSPISGATFGLTKTNTGTLTLSGANTYTGATTINAGTLQLGAADRISNSSNVVLAGGTLNTGGFSDTVGSLNVSGTAVIDMGAGASQLTFASVAGWTGALSVWNWTGTLGVAGGTDRLLFTTPGSPGSSPGTVHFYSNNGTTEIGTGGVFIGNELVPVPEPGAVLAGLLLLVPLAWRERQFFLRVRQDA